MPRQVILRLCSLRSSLVNLPPILASQLSTQSILPQSLGIELQPVGTANSSDSPNGGRLYVGWSGLATTETNERFRDPRRSHKTASSSTHWNITSGTHSKHGSDLSETIELDRTIAKEMGWRENQVLNIRFYHKELRKAKTVNVEPVSVDDWEILESNPQYLEDNILTQIRVVAESQKLFVWVYGKTLIGIKVQTVVPVHTSSAESDSHVPYLLTNETEIIVSPKTRSDSSPHDKVSQERNHVLEGNNPAESKRSQASPHHMKKLYFKVLPQDFVDNLKSAVPDPQEQLPAFSGDADLQRYPEEEYPVIAMNPDEFSQFEATFPTTLCSLTLTLRPRENTTASLATNPSNPNEPDAPVRGIPTQSQKPNRLRDISNQQLPSFNLGDRTRVVANSSIPLGFLYLPASFRKKWFSSLSIDFEQHTSCQLSSRGDFEYIRIGPARSTAPDPPSPASQEPGFEPPDSPGPLEEKKEISSLAGFDHQLELCRRFLLTTLTSGNLYMHGSYRTGNQHLGGLMITGSSGSGKTSLIKKVIQKILVDREIMMYCRYVDCGKHIDDRLGVLKSNLSEWFEDAVWHSPSVLVLDDLDKLFPAEAEHIDSFRYRHLTEEFLSIASGAIRDKLIILVATSSGSGSIHHLLASGTHLFSDSLLLKGLAPRNRREILDQLIQLKALNSSLDINQIDTNALSTDRTEGYLPSDLKDLVDRAVHQAIIRSLNDRKHDPQAMVSLRLVDFENAQSDFVPISLRDVKLQKSNVQWSDIGGLAETRRVLRETLEWPTKYASIFANCPLRLRSGLLLYGYPGCGKTLLASAIAKECGLNFISIKGPELLNKYIGASEKSVRDLFERAQVAKPCVLFFDEFESIAPKRGHDSTGVTDRVVNQLLTQMDGAEGLEGVYVLAATSRPDLIDPALLRPGRLDKCLLCSMPTERERSEILAAVSRTLPLDDQVQFDEIASETEGFTGADLQALVYSAHLKVVHESINSKPNGFVEISESARDRLQRDFKWLEIQPIKSDGADTNIQRSITKSQAEQEAIRKRIQHVLEKTYFEQKSSTETHTSHILNGEIEHPIEMRHLRLALSDARPSVPREELIRLNRIYQHFVSSRSDGGLPDGEASEQIGGRASLM